MNSQSLKQVGHKDVSHDMEASKTQIYKFRDPKTEVDEGSKHFSKISGQPPKFRELELGF